MTVKQIKKIILSCFAVLLASFVGYSEEPGKEPDLVGYWKLRGDCRDF